MLHYLSFIEYQWVIVCYMYFCRKDKQKYFDWWGKNCKKQWNILSLRETQTFNLRVVFMSFVCFFPGVSDSNKAFPLLSFSDKCFSGAPTLVGNLDLSLHGLLTSGFGSPTFVFPLQCCAFLLMNLFWLLMTWQDQFQHLCLRPLCCSQHVSRLTKSLSRGCLENSFWW